MNVERLADHLEGWLREEVESAGCAGVVFGLSGGIDSATVAVLARRAFRDNHLALILPVHSDPRDAQDARLIVGEFGLRSREIVLDGVYDQFLAALGVEPPAPDAQPDVALANLKPRLRMATLYYWAARLGFLVVGTGNRSELSLGYFTKHGDGGVDLVPLGHLVKADVRELAIHLGIPQSIVAKPPSAGIWRGQTDEQELGFTYDALDEYLLAGTGEPELAAKVDALRRRNAHKLRTPKMPPPTPAA